MHRRWHQARARRALGWGASSLLLPGLLAMLTGCGSDDLTTGTFVDPTEIAVNPDDFLGEVSCGPNAGSARAYVMTLVFWDSADDTTPFVIGSSRPASCAFVAGFRNVLEGNRYTAFVDVYDVPPDALFPFGGASSGARQMRDANGEVLDPRWQTPCGRSAEDAAIALQNRRVFVRPCDPLQLDGETPTQLAFPPELVLGSEAPCDVAPSVHIAFSDGERPPTDLACDDEPAVFDVSAGTYQLYATVDDGSELQGTSCLATVAAGTTATPNCEPLTSFGHARVSLNGLSDGDGNPVCPQGSNFDVFDGDQILNAIPLPCGTNAQLGPFEAGIKTLEVTVYDDEGKVQGNGATCAADIEPGRTVNAVCTP